MTEAIIRIATHDGAFHADDVLATAILTTIFPSHQIIRTRDPDILEMADIVVDVGGSYDHRARRYDHHMPNPPMDRYEHILSSAGLVWRHYCRSYLRAIGIPKDYTHKERTIDLYDQIDKIIKTRWIYPIDRNDNGVSNGPTAISEVVSSMSPIDAEKSRSRFDALFLEAVSMVAHLFKRACFHAVDYAISKVKYMRSEKWKLSNDRILVAETDVRHFGNFSNSPVHFVIYPVKDHNDGGEYWIIRPIYESLEKTYKTPFPSNLLGLNREEIEAQGVEGISFVHHSGFMARAVNRAYAVAFCMELLET